MERLRSWTRDEFVLTVLFWICLSMSTLFYLLADAERTVQIKLERELANPAATSKRFVALVLRQLHLTPQ